MPNGRNSLFAILREELQNWFSSVPADTVIGEWCGQSGSVSAEEAKQALANHRDGWVTAEEQYHSFYIVRILGTLTWIALGEESPVYPQLRQWHQRWYEDERLRDEFSRSRPPTVRRRRRDLG